jgi:hypothetical protein
MRKAWTFIAIPLLAVLASCGGGGSDAPSAPTAQLLAAPHALADVGLCAAQTPGYATVNGQCQQLFGGMKPHSTASSTPPPAGSASQPKPQVRASYNVAPDDFFNWAQASYSYFFGGAYTENSAYLSGYGTFLYRYYFDTGNFLGILDGYVYVYGPITGWYVTPVGTLSDYACDVYNCGGGGSRSFITWTNSMNGVVVKDANNEDFAFYSDDRCLYSYATGGETTNFCLYSGSSSGNFAGIAMQVMLASGSNGGCVAVLADYYGHQIDIYTNSSGTQIVSPLNTYWQTYGCTY